MVGERLPRVEIASGKHQTKSTTNGERIPWLSPSFTFSENKEQNNTTHTHTQKSKLSTHIAPCARYFCACHKGYNMLLPPHWLKKGGGVNRSYLGNSVVFQLVLVRPRCVHPKTFACCHATCTSCTLIGWCLRRRTFHTGHKSTRAFFQYG